MIILDTNVISEAMTVSPNAKALQWLSSQPPQLLFTTTVSMAEILFGIELLPVGKRRSGLLKTAETMFATIFAGRILAFDESAARAFSGIAAARRMRGRPMATLDAQIVAICRANGAMLATRNTAHFEYCDVQLMNPWLD
jgi:predicted nucleic acid-binding protein